MFTMGYVSMRHRKVLLFVFLTVVAAMSSGFSRGGFTSAPCVENERQALLSLKQHFVDPSNRLSSWIATDEDCCKWHGVVCHNTTGHVHQLNLGNLDNFSEEGTPGFEVFRRSRLGGKINPSLLSLEHLRRLDLGYNDFGGIQIPPFLGSLGRLRVLDLSEAGFAGKIPPQLGNLSNLRTLYLSHGFQHDEKAELYADSLQWLSNLSSLEFLYFFRVNLKNIGSDWLQVISRLPSLQTLYLSRCRIGHIPTLPNNLNFSSLSMLALPGNNFNGSIPMWIFGLNNLKRLLLGGNSFGGFLTKFHFTNLTKLRFLSLSGSQIVLRVEPFWVPPFQLEQLNLRACSFGPRFPLWLHSQKGLSFLDISGAGIVDSIPTWIWNFSSSFKFLNLSHNHMYGEIPLVTPNVGYLDLSSNRFSGAISRFLCHRGHEPKSLKFLNLDNNLLSGGISDCWADWKDLKTISIENNNLTGNIFPSLGFVEHLVSLHLRNNSLSGELSLPVQKLTQLVTLDLSENNVVGNVPGWIGEKLPSLRYLILHSNKFEGDIPHELCLLTSLQVLNLSNNSLSGTIPGCSKNFRGMVMKQHLLMTTPYEVGPLKFSFYEHALLLIRGREDDYWRNLGFVTNLDLSNNYLSGVIPKEPTYLMGLVSLSLSSNQFTGRIPMDIGNLALLESLDLSSNHLSGEIPASMHALTLLNHLNLSYNKLTGQIPSSTQLQTLDAASFTGNELCGAPLEVICGKQDGLPYAEVAKRNLGSGFEMEWFYLSMVPGFVVGFWAVMVPLLFNKSWRYAYFRGLDNLGHGFCQFIGCECF